MGIPLGISVLKGEKKTHQSEGACPRKRFYKVLLTCQITFEDEIEYQMLVGQ